MKNLIRFGAASALAAMPFAAQAQTATGNLAVETSVAAACTIFAQDALALPFGAIAPLDNGQQFADPVTVDINCTGAPTINDVAFDDGLHIANVTGAEIELRYMFRDGGTQGTGTDYLGYQLGAVAGTAAGTGADVWDNGNNVIETAAGPAGSNELDTPTTAFQVTARIFESNDRAHGDSQDGAATETVPAGDYADTVVMTVSFTG